MSLLYILQINVGTYIHIHICQQSVIFKKTRPFAAAAVWEPQTPHINKPPVSNLSAVLLHCRTVHWSLQLLRPQPYTF